METMTWEAQVFSDVFHYGHSEEGHPLEQLAFYVVCENRYGDRYASRLQFTTVDASRESAEIEAGILLRKVRHCLRLGASPVKSEKWMRHHPVYGSEAYAEYGQADEVAWERAQG